MSELAYFAVQYGFLILLWLFVYLASRTIATDIYGGSRRRAAGSAQAAAQSRAPAAARELVVTRGALAGTRVALGSAPVTLGRAPGSTIVLTDDYASTHHARIYPRDGQWVIEDLGSTNGTYLSRTRVTGPTAVPLGTPVTIGKTTLELRA